MPDSVGRDKIAGRSRHERPTLFLSAVKPGRHHEGNATVLVFTYRVR